MKRTDNPRSTPKMPKRSTMLFGAALIESLRTRKNTATKPLLLAENVEYFTFDKTFWNMDKEARKHVENELQPFSATVRKKNAKWEFDVEMTLFANEKAIASTHFATYTVEDPNAFLKHLEPISFQAARDTTNAISMAIAAQLIRNVQK